MVPLKQKIIYFLTWVLFYTVYPPYWKIDPILVRSQYTNILHVGLCVGAYKVDNNVLFDTEYTVSNLNIKRVSEESVLKHHRVFIGCMQMITSVGCHSGKFNMFMKFIHYFPQFVSNDVCLVKRTDSLR